MTTPINRDRLIAERALGHPLRLSAPIHHVNGRRKDNRRRNLVICDSHAYHRLLHVLQRVKDAGGRPFLDRICGDCGEVKPITAFYLRMKRGRRQPDQRCKMCNIAGVGRRREKRQMLALERER